MAHWIFGYGSIIWNPGFVYLESRLAYLPGWTRRFWQGSTDHRGIPGHPGLVATLVAHSTEGCWGMAYRVEEIHLGPTLSQLDVREQGGYERHILTARAVDGEEIECLAYIAGPGNPDWVGEQSQDLCARQILGASGPSGDNPDYVFRLARALSQLGHPDPHVEELAQLCRQLGCPGSRGPVDN